MKCHNELTIYYYRHLLTICAAGRSRTDMGLIPQVFETCVSAIPPPRRDISCSVKRITCIVSPFIYQIPRLTTHFLNYKTFHAPRYTFRVIISSIALIAGEKHCPDNEKNTKHPNKHQETGDRAENNNFIIIRSAKVIYTSAKVYCIRHG